MKTRQIATALVGLAAFGLANSSQAAAAWTYFSCTTGSGGTCNSLSSLPTSSSDLDPGFGNSRTSSGPGPIVTATGWSNTGTGGTIETAYLSAWDVSSYDNYAGLGVTNKKVDAASSSTTIDVNENESPDHATDSHLQHDLILIDFGANKLGKITGVYNSWVGSDSDMTILAYTGTATGPNISGKTLAQLDDNAATMWTRVSDEMDQGTEKRYFSTTLESRFWLVTPYHNVFGGSYGSSYVGNDYFKLKAIKAEVRDGPPPPNGAPEPGSIALVGIGMLGLVAIRRRRR